MRRFLCPWTTTSNSSPKTPLSKLLLHCRLDAHPRSCFNTRSMKTLELVGETLTFLESDGNGNWYTNEDAEEIYISNPELRGDAPHFTWK